MLPLDAIQGHPKYPFLDIQDRESYLLAQLYWLQIVKASLGSCAPDWDSWLPQDESWDGSTILSARRRDRTKGLIIDQQGVARDLAEYGEAHRPLVVFLGVWEDEGDGHPMPYLKIFARISEDTLKLSTHLLKAWTDPKMSQREMQVLIDRYNNHEDILRE